ncbi:MAG: ATP-binding protein [Cyanobacteria bacterium J06639_14]
MGHQEHHAKIQELEKTIRILRKKLERSERERGQIESDVATKEALLKNVIHELRTSQKALEQKSQDLQDALERLQRMQMQLVKSEKMSALGQTTAGIAHEINNPLSFIYGNLYYLDAYIQDLFKVIHLYDHHLPLLPGSFCSERESVDITLIEDDIPQILQSMHRGTQRIQDIVLALRNFSRLDEAGYKAINLHENLDSILMILRQKMTTIQVFRNYGKLPLVTCAVGEMNQVFMNILSNAIDAIAQKRVSPLDTGVILIETKFHSDQQVVITIKDNGIGMEPNIIDKIFDPFFTTKENGKGAGLGLAIARQIVVEQHGGHLDVQTEVGQGTEFIISLPIQH